MKWNKEFQLKDLLDTDTSAESTIKAATATIERLEAKKPFGTDTSEALADDFRVAVESGDCDDFNFALSYLYDVADMQKVWIS